MQKLILYNAVNASREAGQLVVQWSQRIKHQHWQIFCKNRTFILAVLHLHGDKEHLTG